MKERQHAEHAVGVIDRVDLRGGVDVRDQVPVREHHAFGRAGAAAGEDDRGEIVRLGCAGQVLRAGSNRAAAIVRALDAGAERRQHVFQKHSAGQFGKLGLFEKRARGKDGRDPAFVDGMRHGFFARGEVEIDGGLAGQRDAEIRQRAADRGRKQQSDGARPGAVGVDPFLEEQRGGQGLAEAELFAGGIGNRDRTTSCVLAASTNRCDSVLAALLRHSAA